MLSDLAYGVSKKSKSVMRFEGEGWRSEGAHRRSRIGVQKNEAYFAHNFKHRLSISVQRHRCVGAARVHRFVIEQHTEATFWRSEEAWSYLNERRR